MRDNVAGNLTAGVGAGLTYLPLMVIVAIIAFGPLGPDTAATLTSAVFAANIAAGIMFFLLARCPVLVGTPSASSALVIAALFARLIAQGTIPGVAEALAITISVGVVAAIVQLALVNAGAAALGPLAPYPIVSGLVNGTAVLILMSQLPPLRVHPFEMAIAAVACATMLLFPVRWKVPPVLPAVAAGMAVAAVLHRLGLEPGPYLTAMPSPAAYPAVAAHGFTAWATNAAKLPWADIAIAGVTIALLGVLETLGTISALTDLGIVTGARRDLATVGYANLAVAAVGGGPPVGAPLSGPMTPLKTGGSGRLAPLSRVAPIAVGGVFLGGYLPLVPQGAMVGLVLAIGYRLLDPEPVRLLWRAVRHDAPIRMEIGGSAFISLAVVGVAVVAGLAVAVAVGAAACLLVFTAAMAGSAIHRVYDGAAALSRMRRSVEETAVLLRDRKLVSVIELGGPLFFGNISPLGDALDRAQAAGARHIVVDLSRVTRVDLSGARRLISYVRQRRQKGLTIVLAPFHPGHPVADYFAALAIDPGEHYPEVTEALAAAENAVLAEAGLPAPSFATSEAALEALGIAPDHARVLATHAEAREFAANEMLCRAGEPADALFVVMHGRVDVLLPAQRVVLAHLAAGAVIGERVLFEAGTRTADVVCAAPSRVLILSGSALTGLMRDASPAALALVVAVAQNTSMSLQLANAAISRLETHADH